MDRPDGAAEERLTRPPAHKHKKTKKRRKKNNESISQNTNNGKALMLRVLLSVVAGGVCGVLGGAKIASMFQKEAKNSRHCKNRTRTLLTVKEKRE